MTKTTDRIEDELGIQGLTALLAERLAPTDLQSLLLEVYRLKAQQRSAAEVLADYEANRFVQPSSIAPARLAEWERVLFANLPDGFEALTLAPVSPLGTSSAVGLVDQNRVVSTVRNTEVVSDSTNVLALECALRRRKRLRENPKSAAEVHLAASHRLLRAQKYDNNPNLVPHFSAFALVSAGRDTGNWRFEQAALVAQIGFYMRSLRAFAGADLRLRVAMTVSDRKQVDVTELFASTQPEFANIEWVMDDKRESARSYYAGLCFHLYAAAETGAWLELVDGGAVDWTQKLLSSAKERCVISGIGSERVCMEWPSM